MGDYIHILSDHFFNWLDIQLFKAIAQSLFEIG